MSELVQVHIRVKPIKNEKNIWFIEKKRIGYRKNNKFVAFDSFESIYYAEDTKQIYDEQVKPKIIKFMNNENTTILAYGQTGSGKTYTMIGENNNGLINYALKDIFNSYNISKTSENNKDNLNNYKDNLNDDNLNDDNLNNSNINDTNIIEVDSKKRIESIDNNSFNKDDNINFKNNKINGIDNNSFNENEDVQNDLKYEEENTKVDSDKISTKKHSNVQGSDYNNKIESSVDGVNVLENCFESNYKNVLKNIIKPDTLNNVNGNFNSEIKISYIEIYNEKVYDLYTLKDVGVFTKDKKTVLCNLHDEVVRNEEEAQIFLNKCNLNRRSSATEYNINSSRSHSIIKITKGENYVTFIDLAGSEKACKSQDRRKEGAYINKSLLALGKLITNLLDNKYTCFRDSKLTRILSGSFNGKSSFTVFCMISTSKEYLEESLSTLQFAARMSNLNLKTIELDSSVVSKKYLLYNNKETTNTNIHCVCHCNQTSTKSLNKPLPLDNKKNEILKKTLEISDSDNICIMENNDSKFSCKTKTIEFIPNENMNSNKIKIENTDQIKLKTDNSNQIKIKINKNDQNDETDQLSEDKKTRKHCNNMISDIGQVYCTMNTKSNKINFISNSLSNDNLYTTSCKCNIFNINDNKNNEFHWSINNKICYNEHKKFIFQCDKNKRKSRNLKKRKKIKKKLKVKLDKINKYLEDYYIKDNSTNNTSFYSKNSSDSEFFKATINDLLNNTITSVSESMLESSRIIPYNKFMSDSIINGSKISSKNITDSIKIFKSTKISRKFCPFDLIASPTKKVIQLEIIKNNKDINLNENTDKITILNEDRTIDLNEDKTIDLNEDKTISLNENLESKYETDNVMNRLEYIKKLYENRILKLEMFISEILNNPISNIYKKRFCDEKLSFHDNLNRIINEIVTNKNRITYTEINNTANITTYTKYYE